MVESFSPYLPLKNACLVWYIETYIEIGGVYV